MKTLKPSRFSSRHLLIFAILFGLVGGYIVIRSFAAPNPNLAGDLNGDNTVDKADLAILLPAYGTTNVNADINHDGQVTALDLSILLSHYGATTSLSPTVNLTANPTSITSGQAVTLQWTSTNATSCSAPWTASSTTSGQQTVSPTVTTTYSITCNGSSNSANDSLTVTVNPVGGGTLNSVSKILYDMKAPNEGTAHGGLSGSLLPPLLSYNLPPAGTTSVEAWGQIYADSTNVYPANVRVETKNMETYLWSLSQKKWVRVQAVTPISGAWYSYNFASHITADKRTEPDGGVSVSMQDGYLYHIFPSVHAALTVSDVGGVFTTYQARIILDNSSGPYNLYLAKYLANCGADFYPAGGSYPGPLPPAGTGNVAVGSSRLIYLTPQWQAMSFYTGGPSVLINDGRAKYPAAAWTEAQLQASPPPIDALGLP